MEASQYDLNGSKSGPQLDLAQEFGMRSNSDLGGEGGAGGGEVNEDSG